MAAGGLQTAANLGMISFKRGAPNLPCPELTMTTAIHTALEAFRPQLAAAIAYRIERNYKRMTELAAQNGGGWWGINAWLEPETQRMWSETTRRCCDANGFTSTDGYTLNPDKVAKFADRQVTDMLASWEAKLVAKLAELDNAEAVRQHSGVAFIVTGTKAGKPVSIEQSMIVNVSSKGLLFNQFPARIYVAGKFTSEAAYKRQFATA